MRRFVSLIFLAGCVTAHGCYETGGYPDTDAAGIDDAGSVEVSGDAAAEDAATPSIDTNFGKPDGDQDTAAVDALPSTDAGADVDADPGPAKVDTYAECKTASHCPDAGPCLQASCVVSRCVYASVEAKGCFTPPDACAPGNRRPWRLFAFPGYVRIGWHGVHHERFQNLSSLAVDALPPGFQHAMHVSWRADDENAAGFELGDSFEWNSFAGFRAEGMLAVDASGIGPPPVGWFFNYYEEESTGNNQLVSPLRWLADEQGTIFLDRFRKDCNDPVVKGKWKLHLPGSARYGRWNALDGYMDLIEPPCLAEYWTTRMVNWGGKAAVLGGDLNKEKFAVTAFQPDGALGPTTDIPTPSMFSAPSFLTESKILWREWSWILSHPPHRFNRHEGSGDPSDKPTAWYTSAVEQSTLAQVYKPDWKTNFDAAVDGFTLATRIQGGGAHWVDRTASKRLVFGGYAVPDGATDSLAWTYELWGLRRSDGGVAWRKQMHRRIWPLARWASLPLQDDALVFAARWNAALIESDWPYFGVGFRSFPAIGIYDSDTGKRLWERVVPGVDAENPRAVWEYQESAPQLFDVGDGSFALFHRIVDEKAAAKDGLDPRRYLWREYGPDGSPCLDASKDLCLGKVPSDCEDGDPCTFDFCLPAQGCVHKTYVDAVCDLADGTRGACNSAGQCEAVMW